VFFLVLSMAGTLAGFTLTTLTAALFANWLSLRVYEDRGLLALGLAASRASAKNAAIGLAGGLGAACVVLALPLATGAAHLAQATDHPPNGAIPFAAGSVGEEMLFHGYAFQVVLGVLGRTVAVLAAGIVFGLMHSANPHATWFGLANTAGFGILFGYAFLRSRDLWLPIGLHFGWNFTLPLFGVNLSGFTMGLTGYGLRWRAGDLWSGGGYGPEGSVLTTGIVAALFFVLERVTPEHGDQGP
jgi:membrane protease YdiL (CAAX protease family)